MINRSLLVTGASGFIGSCLVRRLLKDGYVVHVVMRFTSDTSLVDEFRDSLCIHYHDGSTAGLVDIVSSAAPSAVFHLASLFLSEHTTEDVEQLVNSNMMFATQLVEAMSVNNVKLLVNTGTSWQHYQNMDYNPVCLYAALKQAFECVLRYYVEAHRFQVITLSLFDTYGPGDRRPKLFNIFKRASISDEPLAMSAGAQLIDLVYIDDVVNAFLVAYHKIQDESFPSMETFALSSGTPLPLLEIAKVYENITRQRLNITWGGRSYRAREVMVPWTSFETLPGWCPEIDLIDGIRRTILE